MARAHERMLNLMSHRGTATQNHHSASLHAHEGSYDNNNHFFKNQKITSVKEVDRPWEVATENVKWGNAIGGNGLLIKAHNYLIIHSSFVWPPKR